MIKDMIFTGYEKIQSNFENKLTDKKIKKNNKGSITISIGTVSSSDLIDKMEDNILIYPIHATLEGFIEDKETCIFESSFQAILNFKLLNDAEVTEKFLDDNDWFFSNFSSVVAKELLDLSLKSTSYEKLRLPIHRHDEKYSINETKQSNKAKKKTP